MKQFAPREGRHAGADAGGAPASSRHWACIAQKHWGQAAASRGPERMRACARLLEVGGELVEEVVDDVGMGDEDTMRKLTAGGRHACMHACMRAACAHVRAPAWGRR
jgi:hypothetical protein